MFSPIISYTYSCYAPLSMHVNNKPEKLLEFIKIKIKEIKINSYYIL